MFNFNWLRGNAPSTNGSPMESWFNPGVVCPDGTVTWHWAGDDFPSNRSSEDKSALFPKRPSLSMEVQHSEKIHYHYHRFGMGPWLFLGLQMSLAIALLLTLSPDSQPPTPDTSLDSLTIPKPDYLIGFLY